MQNESLSNYTRCIQAVTLGLFLQKALQDQKRWMRRFLKKPRDMPVQDYIAQVIEINDYLAEFPPTIVDGNAIKLPDNELLDLLEFGIPTPPVVSNWLRPIDLHTYVQQYQGLR